MKCNRQEQEYGKTFENSDLYEFKNTDKFLGKFLLDNYLEVIKEKAIGIPLIFLSKFLKDLLMNRTELLILISKNCYLFLG